MKNNQPIFLVFISIILTSSVLSQNIFPASGRAGINTVNPAAALHVIGGARIGNTTNFVNIDSATGNLAFAGSAGYRVAGNNYVFQYNGNPNYGLFFNQTNVRYEFRNNAAAPTFYIGADNGNGYFAGGLGVGVINPAATLDVAGNIKIADGTQGAGRVLVSDANGLASWQTIPAGVSGNGATGNLTYWTSPNTIGANSNLFWDNLNNRLGLNTTTPTHSLTLGNTGNGLVLYNTSDQTTNYERFGLSWQSNILDIGTFYGGSGTPRQVRIGIQQSNGGTSLTGGRIMTISLNPSSTKGVFDFQVNTGGIGNIVSAGGIFSQNSGISRLMDLHPSYSQTSAAGYTVLRISPYEGSTGSSAKLLIDAGTNSEGNGGGTHISKFNVDHSGNGYFSGNLGIGNINPAAKLDIAGNIKITDGTQAAGKVLISDANGLASWQTIPAGISGSGSSGNLAYWTTANSIGANNNLFWDNTNNRFGLGNNTPAATLDLTGNIRIVDGSQAIGKVLTSDQNGFASWQTIPTSLSGSGSAGNISIWAGTNSLGYSNNFFWDNANSRLGIGTAIPSVSLDVAGKIRLADGTQGTGKILVSDVNGIGSWQTLPAGVGGSGIAGNIAIWSGTGTIGSNTSLTWDNVNRRLGIGVATPTARLDILGNIKIADGTQGLGKVLTSDANGLATWQTPAAGISGSGAAGYLTLWSSANSLSANTNLYWDNTNNRLGLGNNLPVASLDIAGNIKIADGTQGNGKVLTSDANGIASWQNVPQGISGTGTAGSISFWNGPNSLSANTNLFWDNVNNRLGIGSNSPDASVDIEGNIKIADGTQGPGKVLTSNANGLASWQTMGASSWSVNGNNIYSNNSGNVGIGTNNPSSKLQVRGDVILSDTSDNTSGNVTIGASINNYKNSKLYVKSTLAYGVFIEAPTVSQWGLYLNGSLYVNGTAAKPGSSTWTVISDERLKSNIKPYTEGLEQVMKINPVKYHYNSESGFDTKNEYIGVVAQQIEKIAPYMVGKFKRDFDKKEFLNVNNGAMTYMLINAVKELKADADTKEATIKNQQAQIDLLQNQMTVVMQKLNEVQAVQRQCCSVTSVEIPTLNNQSVILSDAASLEQNLPNPFKNKTIIKYHLPFNVNNAQLIISSNAGKTINTIKLNSKTQGQVTFDAGTLSPGTYYYSLLVNGNKVDTKKMEILR